MRSRIGIIRCVLNGMGFYWMGYKVIIGYAIDGLGRVGYKEC